MDIKCKTCDIQIWRKHLFLDISSINTDTFVPLLYQCVEMHSIKVFWLLSQKCPHLCFNLFIISETFAIKWFFSWPNRWKSLRAKYGL
jgi:hypothetical protein